MSTSPWRSTAGWYAWVITRSSRDSGGDLALITWAETHERIETFGIEGTGSNGAGAEPPGQSDTLDAAAAARSVLAGQSTAVPKTADGTVEMMR